MEVASSSPSVILEEWNGSSSTKLSKTATITASPSLSIQRSTSYMHHVWSRIFEAFVPEGFPSSVTPDYVPFQVWDSLQGLSTYIRTMLSTQALLSAIGVGEKSATVIGATFQWFLRDLTGMVGGILFTFYQGSNLDSNAKMWRLVADLMNDLGMLMDLTSPLFPSAFVFLVCLGSLSRSFTGVASGATRAALTQHFALQNNAADISAKEGSQETLATMSGMALGMLLARITMGHPLAIWFLFLSLTVFHMYANYKAVQCLALSSLNPQRNSIILQHFMKTGQVLSAEQVSKMEHILPIWASSWSLKCSKLLHMQICLGVRVSALSHPELTDLLRNAGSHYRKAKYVLVERNGIISVIMHKDSTAEDVLQSFVHAYVMATLIGKTSSIHTESQSWIDAEYILFLQKDQLSGQMIGSAKEVSAEVIRLENRASSVPLNQLEGKLELWVFR
ncbi:protein root UVB sensitive 3 isoform X4 [Humulus lupulus]|uniref:protein root UVB sensitive 3 isoform X4 n=1 Tax=Humulus lupulus TaxID=3486 RepID=UPI002B41007A|nr:protein root UVB sensitive 3 isoform X4 [Humulus lupulus]